MKKARFRTCEVSESGFFKVCEFPKITSGVQALIDLQLCITFVMLTPFGIGIMLIVFSLNVLRLAHYIYLYESFCDS